MCQIPRVPADCKVSKAFEKLLVKAVIHTFGMLKHVGGVGPTGRWESLFDMGNPTIISNQMDRWLPLTLQKWTKGEWRRGSAPSDKDCMNVHQLIYSFEIKTTSRYHHVPGDKASLLGPKVKKVKVRTGNFLVISYNFKTRQLRDIRFGFLTDGSEREGGCWKISKSKSSNSATVSVPIQLMCLDTLWEKHK